HRVIFRDLRDFVMSRRRKSATLPLKAERETMDSTTFYTKQEASAERLEFYGRLKTQNAAPLWEVLGDLVRSDPRTACLPTLWRYDDVRPLIAEAGTIITAEEAE